MANHLAMRATRLNDYGVGSMEEKNLTDKPDKAIAGQRTTSKYDVDVQLVQDGQGRHVAWNQTLKIVTWAVGTASMAISLKAVEGLIHR